MVYFPLKKYFPKFELYPSLLVAILPRIASPKILTIILLVKNIFVSLAMVLYVRYLELQIISFNKG